ncbi:MAG: glutamine-hydrolyzing carbamoyl-phosphate synthase small subunit [Thermodesulfobacteriota bacterium]
MLRAILALSDGTVFEGFSFGASGTATGEVCFNTSMTGYQEVLTDPSYCGHIVAMTYPHQGNYGINEFDIESHRPWVEGFIVRDPANAPSSWRSEEPLDGYMRRHGIVGISGIDTRALTRIIRDSGAMMALISTEESAGALVESARVAQGLKGRDLASVVSSKEPFSWHEGVWSMDDPFNAGAHVEKGLKYKVAVYDFGIKRNILRLLYDAGCDVTVVPAKTSAEEVLSTKPDGIFLSNGPGDPAAVGYAINTVKKLVESRIPLFGICLGHQILALALGAGTFKLKFGHRGINQPVKDLSTGRVEITSQNHGFAVELESLAGLAEVTHINLNDKTVEGLRLQDRPVFSVQYHPEASPGPHDSQYLFRRFTSMMEKP